MFFLAPDGKLQLGSDLLPFVRGVAPPGRVVLPGGLVLAYNREKTMPDGKRKRRQGRTPRARYYSVSRGVRFGNRFGMVKRDLLDVLKKWGLNPPQEVLQ